MKLSYPSSSVCCLQIQPWGGRSVGVIFALVGLGILGMYFTVSTIECGEKKPGVARHCELIEKIAYWYSSTTPIGQLKGSKIKTIYNPPSGNQSGNYSYQVLLSTEHESGGLSFSALNSSSYAKAQNIMQVIQDYVAHSSATKVVLPSAMPFWLLLFPLLFIPIGVVVFLTSARVRLELNKTTQKMSFYRTSLTGTSQNSYDFTQLAQFFVDSQWSQANNNPGMSGSGFQFGSQTNSGQQVYALMLELENHQRIQITPNYDSFYQNKATIAAKLNDWIKPSTSSLDERRVSVKE